MFLIIGTNSGISDFGYRRCLFPLPCGCQGGAFSCSYQALTLFFLPLLRFGRRYFLTCSCGAMYEMPKEEGKRLEKNPNAEIDPHNLFIVQSSSKKTCPFCKSSVNRDSLYGPRCGAKL